MYKHFKHCLIIISVAISWWFPGWHHFIPRSWQLGSGVIHGRCTSLIYQKLIKNKYDQICSIACMYMQWSLVCNKFGRRGIFQNKANDYYDWFLCRFRNAEKFDRLLRNEVPPDGGGGGTPAKILCKNREKLENIWSIYIWGSNGVNNLHNENS